MALADLATPTRPFKPITTVIKHTAATRAADRATGNISGPKKEGAPSWGLAGPMAKGQRFSHLNRH